MSPDGKGTDFGDSRCCAARSAAGEQKDPLGRDTPQGLVAGLICALSDGDYDRAVRFFETDTMGAGVGRLTLSGATLARRFQEMLDRAGSVITPAELSADPGWAAWTTALPKTSTRSAR